MLSSAWNGAAAVYQHRGFERFKLGQVREAIRTSTVPGISAGSKTAHGGALRYYAGRFDDRRKQFEFRKRNPNDVENAVWHYLVAGARGVNERVLRSSRSLPTARSMMKFTRSFWKGSAPEILAAADAGAASSGT